MVIATWGPNVKATAAAWEVLSKNGRALDAVEAGARIPEADPNDTSVGYGGFPDRGPDEVSQESFQGEDGNLTP